MRGRRIKERKQKGLKRMKYSVSQQAPPSSGLGTCVPPAPAQVMVFTLCPQLEREWPLALTQAVPLAGLSSPPGRFPSATREMAPVLATHDGAPCLPVPVR